MSPVEEFFMLGIQLNCQSTPATSQAPVLLPTLIRVSTLKIRVLAKPISRLLDRYEILDRKLSSESHKVSETEVKHLPPYPHLPEEA